MFLSNAQAKTKLLRCISGAEVLPLRIEFISRKKCECTLHCRAPAASWKLLFLLSLFFFSCPYETTYRSMCKLWTTADLTLCTASIVSLCAISVDRYLVITRPLRYSAMRTTARMLVYIAIVWVIAAVVSVSSHIIANLLDTQEVDDRICQVWASSYNP